VPDIFDEVEEDLRAERAQALLKRYGGALVAGAVAIVVAAGAWEGWQWYDAKQVGAVADTYLAAMQTVTSQKGPARQAAAAGFAEVAAKGRSGYRTLARLQEAALKADAGDLAAASALWNEVAGDSAADPLLRDLANLAWAIHHVDSADPAQVEARLRPLAEPASPFHPLAQETLAMLDLRQGKTQAARAALGQLAQDVTAPPTVRRRAQGVLARIGA